MFPTLLLRYYFSRYSSWSVLSSSCIYRWRQFHLFRASRLFSLPQYLAMECCGMCCSGSTVSASGPEPYHLTKHFIFFRVSLCFTMCCTVNSPITRACFLSVSSSFLWLLVFCLWLYRSVPSFSCSLYGEFVALSMKMEFWIYSHPLWRCRRLRYQLKRAKSLWQ